ncbi:DUF1571 domain-containing protein [bacterium]|nr:DUF1571 domain-containing protein [bacterium]
MIRRSGFTIALMLALASMGSASAEDTTEAKLRAFADTLIATDDARITVRLRHNVGGKLRAEETVEMWAGPDGAMYAHWTGKAHKGRELVWRKDLAGGKAWIKEGGALDFAAVAIAPDDKVVARDYRGAITDYHPAAIGRRAAAYLDGGTITRDDHAFVATKPSGESVRVVPNGDRPSSVVFKDAKGATLLEEYHFDAWTAPAGLSAADFDPGNSAFGFPGVAPGGIFIDPVKLKNNLQGRYARVKGYTGKLEKRERVGGELQKTQFMFVKFRKPSDLYMKWYKGPHEGRELLFRAGQEDKMLVHEGGVLNVLNVRVDPQGDLVKKDTNHHILEIDLGFVVKTIYENLSRGIESGDMKLEFKGIEKIGDRYVYVVESTVPAGKGYYAPKSVSGHDIETGFPVLSRSFDEKGQMFEEFIWTDLRLDPGLADADFDSENPEYKF